MNEMPDNIEEIFSASGLHLLPYDEEDFDTNCSCPDWANPCKHIAGVYYRVASELDKDPFLMFTLRGLEQKNLQKELKKSPLGKILLSSFEEKEVKLKLSDSYYTEPQKEDLSNEIDFKEFWMAEKKLPQNIDPVEETVIPAILIKKQGGLSSFLGEGQIFYRNDGRILRESKREK